jgi:hypothetical protein
MPSFPSISIPAPTDSYDHDNSTRANMTSVKALIASFDASMDSLSVTIEEEMKRLDQIQIRIENYQKLETVEKGNFIEKDCIIRVVCPSTFLDQDHGNDNNKNTAGTRCSTTAVVPFATTTNKNRSGASTSHSRSRSAIQCEPFYFPGLSSIYKAKQAATDAILTVLKEEALTMQTTAKPSDVWLDRACACEEAKECRTALLKYRVPPLLASTNQNSSTSSSIRENISKCSKSNRMKQEAEYYRKGMSAMLNESNTRNARKQEEKGLDDRSVVTSMMNQSVASGRITAYTMGNYSTYSQNTQGTASYRRRQRKIRAATTSLAMKEKVNELDDGSHGEEGNDENGIVTKSTPTAYETLGVPYGKGTHFGTSSRQHFMSGGLSYICEMLHDTYGLGNIHQSNIYPKVQNVCDLCYHGTDEIAYSMT